MNEEIGCSICRFSSLHPDNDSMMLCRRQCPAETASNGVAKWPIVKADDWCGDFEERIDG